MLAFSDCVPHISIKTRITRPLFRGAHLPTSPSEREQSVGITFIVGGRELLQDCSASKLLPGSQGEIERGGKGEFFHRHFPKD